MLLGEEPGLPGKRAAPAVGTPRIGRARGREPGSMRAMETGAKTTVRGGWAPELGAVVCVALGYSLLATYGTLEFLAEEKLSRAYDYLGESFLRLEATVPTNAESLRIDGRDYVYFGPLPALARLLPNALWPDAFGLWGRIATLCGGLLALGAWLRIVRTVAPELGGGARAALGIAFGLGTPVAFLVSAPYIWHESMVLALAASLWALSFLLDARIGRRLGPATWLGLGCAIGAAYLTRLTFSVPYLATVAALYALAFGAGRALPWLDDPELTGALRRGVNSGCLLVPLAFAVLFQGWYNVERFGSPFVYTSHASLLSYAVYPELGAQHEAVGTFNVRRVPGNLRHYLGGHGRIDAKPPFVHLADNEGLEDDLYLPGYREWNISLWWVSGWLMLGAAVGGWQLVRQRRGPELALALTFSAQFGVVLSYYWVSHRFSAELLPGLCLLFALWLHGAKVPSRAVQVGFGLLLAVSIAFTLASTLSWQVESNWGAPDTYRSALRERFSRRRGRVRPAARRATTLHATPR